MAIRMPVWDNDRHTLLYYKFHYQF